MVKTAVLFETYTRVDTARKVWEQIKQAKPQKLYFYSNKALKERPDDIENNNEIRSWINEIDWNCDLHTFFREEQVDQYTSLYSSKKWLFENEETGIILEDDCVPSMAFFEFCDHFLEIFKDNQKISFISGNNYTGSCDWDGDYVLSRSRAHFGWATWKGRWDNINFKITPEDVSFTDYLSYINDNSLIYYLMSYYAKLSDFIKTTACWDYVWTLNCIKEKQYTISPVVNLVQNIGYYGEHNKNSKGIVFEANVDWNLKYKFENHFTIKDVNDKYDYLEHRICHGMDFKGKLHYYWWLIFKR